jgi:Fe-S-cluster containining protein
MRKDERGGDGVSLCDDCNGACCREMNSPPFCGAEDPGLRALPPAVRADYEAGMKDRDRQGWPDAVPCFWLTPDNRCKHYEHRPEICRAMEMGGGSCLAWRARREAEACLRCGQRHPIIHVLKLDLDPFCVEIQVGLWKLVATTPEALAIEAGKLMNEVQCCRRQLASKNAERGTRSERK